MSKARINGRVNPKLYEVGIGTGPARVGHKHHPKGTGVAKRKGRERQPRGIVAAAGVAKVPIKGRGIDALVPKGHGSANTDLGRVVDFRNNLGHDVGLAGRYIKLIVPPYGVQKYAVSPFFYANGKHKLAGYREPPGECSCGSINAQRRISWYGVARRCRV